MTPVYFQHTHAHPEGLREPYMPVHHYVMYDDDDDDINSTTYSRRGGAYNKGYTLGRVDG